MLDSLVIGAGAAGIAAARRLAERGLSYRLLEAKAAPGGRAATDHESFGVPVDLGGHWLHSPGENPMKAHADALGVRYLARNYATRFARDGRLLDERDNRDCERYIDAALARVAAADGDRPASALFDGTDPWHEAFESEFAAKQGVTTKEGSTLDFARYRWIGEDLPVVGGYGTLVRRLAEGTALSLETPVSRVDSSAAAIRVETPRGTLEARSVIVTVSLGVLRADALRFTPALPAWKRDAIARIPMGSCNKLALRFDRPVFDGIANSVVMPLRGTHEFVELVVAPDRQPIVVCLFNGPFSHAIARAGGPAMADYVLERLAEIFGSALRAAVDRRHIVADWDGDPFVRGCFAAPLPGHADARREMGRPVDDRLFFAGEAVHRDYAGDIHGAWLSGIAAADAAARALGAPDGQAAPA